MKGCYTHYYLTTWPFLLQIDRILTGVTLEKQPLTCSLYIRQHRPCGNLCPSHHFSSNVTTQAGSTRREAAFVHHFTFIYCLKCAWADVGVCDCVCMYDVLTPAAYKRVPSCSVVAKENLKLMAAMASDGLGRVIKESSMKLS